MTMVQTAAPTLQAVSLQEIKDHLQIEHGDHDALLDVMPIAATNYVEGFTKRQLMPATWELISDGFPAGAAFRGRIELPRPPLQAVTAITYLDTAGVEQTLAASAYQVDAKSTPARIAPAPLQTWPATEPGRMNAATITFTAGYADPRKIPEIIRRAMLIMIGHLYQHREVLVLRGQALVEVRKAPPIVDELLRPYVVGGFS